jgi:ankyrin repeat protein
MLRKALQSLPKTLDETYARILSNIDESWSQYVTQILEWLVFSATPLRLTEVAELVAIDIDDDPAFDPDKRLEEPTDILTMCSSLITITKEKVRHQDERWMNYEDMSDESVDYEDIVYNPESYSDGFTKDTTPEDFTKIVRLAHFSVKEYLVSRQIRVGPTVQHSIREIPVNTVIAEICLVYLLQFDKPDSLNSQSLETFPLLNYASRNWVTHARIADNNSDRLTSLIETLFVNEHVYRNWIRVFDPEKPGERPSVWQYSVLPCSPLYYCSLGGLLEPTKRLIQKGVNVNLEEGDLGCPLLAALRNRHENIARLLVDFGADAAAIVPDWPGGVTALHVAAKDGYEFLAADLLSKGATVEAKTNSGETPLYMAVENEHLEIVKQLLDHGANIEVEDHVGNVPLHNAVYNRDEPILNLLLSKGADMEKTDRMGRTIAHIAVETEQLDLFLSLMVRGADTRASDIWGQTITHYAAANGLETIVDRGLDYTEREDNFGKTALHIAADAGQPGVVEVLLRAGANIEARSISDQTPLYYAAAAGHASVVQQLLEAGANLKARDKYGASILYAAATAGEDAEDTVELLLERIEHKSKLGRTLLHHAAAAGDKNMVELLIERGVDLDAKTTAGETALYLAMIRERDEIVRLLREAKIERRTGYAYSDTDSSDYSRPESVSDGDPLPDPDDKEVGTVAYGIEPVFTALYTPGRRVRRIVLPLRY